MHTTKKNITKDIICITPFSKTKMRTQYSSSSFCERTEACCFAHGLAELRSLDTQSPSSPSSVDVNRNSELASKRLMECEKWPQDQALSSSELSLPSNKLSLPVSHRCLELVAWVSSQVNSFLCPDLTAILLYKLVLSPTSLSSSSLSSFPGSSSSSSPGSPFSSMSASESLPDSSFSSSSPGSSSSLLLD